MGKIVNVAILISFFLILNNKVVAQKSVCSKLKENTKLLLINLKKTIVKYSAPFFLNKSELASIILPEYIVYNSSQKIIEFAAIKSFYFLNNKKCQNISFGPFQMKISFIESNLKKVSFEFIKDSFLIEAKKSGAEFIKSNLDYFSLMTTQWEILKIFEYNNFEKNNNENLVQLYRLYNYSEREKSNKIFDKIKCNKKTYEDWCTELLNWYNQ